MANLLIWIEALGWTLIHSLWLGALATLFYALPASAWRERAPQLAYAWGLACMVGLVLALLATLVLQWSAAERHAFERAVSEAHAALPVQAAADSQAASASPPPWNGLAPMVQPWLPALVLAWFLAVLVQGVRVLRSHLALRRLVAASLPVAELAGPVREIARQFGLSRPVAVVSSACARVPFVIGHFEPVIVLPLVLVSGMPWPQLKLILAHEIAHLRRADYLVNWFQLVVEVLLFFHPAVRWLSTELRRLREACCDDLVLRELHHGRADYARALLSLEEFRQDAPLLAPSAAAGALIWRVRRIAGQERLRSRRRTLMALCAGALLSAAMLLNLLLPQWQPGSSPRQLRLDAQLPATAGIARILPAPVPVARLPVAAPLVDVSAGLTLALRPISVVDVPPAAAMPSAPAAIEMAPLPATDELAVMTATQQEDALAADAPALRPVAEIAAGELSRTDAALEERALDRQDGSLPTALFRPAPSYPASAQRAARGPAAIELSFTLSADGKVRDIRTVESPSSRSEFEQAARQALARWLFDPADAERLAGQRLQQRFEFNLVSARAGSDSEARCLISTGTRICRP